METRNEITKIREYVLNPINNENLKIVDETYKKLKQKNIKLKKDNRMLEIQLIERALQLRQSERELKVANDSISDVDKAKTEFLQISSHEIRTPLNGIFGSLYLMKEAEMPEESKILLNMMDESVKRLERFYKKASIITSINTNTYKLVIEKIDIPDLITDIQEDIETELQKNRNSVILKNNENILEMHADVSLLKFCLKEILLNSVNYSAHNSNITVRLYSGKINRCIEIQDSGKGFDINFLNKPLSILSTGEEHFDEKTGLSLAIVELALKKHGGKLEIGNNPEGGAFVKLWFPVKQC